MSIDTFVPEDIRIGQSVVANDRAGSEAGTAFGDIVSLGLAQTGRGRGGSDSGACRFVGVGRGTTSASGARKGSSD